MSGRQGHERVHGPYQHGKRWRVVFVAASGAQSVESFATLTEANQAIVDAREAADNRTVGQAVAAYLHTCPDRGRMTVGYRLRGVLQLPANDRLLVSLTAAVARKLYGDRAKRGLAGATLHGELAVAQRWGAWCVEEGYLRINPFDGIEPVGEVNRGKPKLRVNASRQFLEFLLRDESLEATAVLTAFALGLRASAVVKRTAYDLDDNGWLLWVRDNKTAAGDLEIEVPDFLRPRLMRLAQGKHPNELLFGDLTRHGLHYHTVRLAAAAGVPRVTPHGLRGSAATSAVRLGGSVADVARAIGHADGGKTLKRHYLGGGAVESARARQIGSLLPQEHPIPGLTDGEAGSMLETRTENAFPETKMEDTN